MKKFILLLVSIICLTISQAQNLEIGFHSPLPIRAPYISKIVIQPDGKYLVAGEVAFYGTHRVHGVVRLKADGTRDETFELTTANDLFVLDVELQSSGKIMVLAHKYETTRDINFVESTLYQVSTNGDVIHQIDGLDSANAITVQADDKILLCGRSYLKRFNSDLTTDENFNNSVSFNGSVTDVQQFSTSLVASGMFSVVNGVAKNDLVKIDLNGTIDNSFDTGKGTDDYIGSITVQPDGKILLGTTYINSFNGTQGHGTMRLNSNGSVDTSFNPFSFNGGVSRVYLKGNEIYAAAFLNYNSGYGDYLFKLGDDGSMDLSFSPVQLANFGSFTLGLAVGADGFVISGSPISLNVFGISKFDFTGKNIAGFAPEVSRFGTFIIGSYFSDKLLVAGDFVRVDGFETYGIASLNVDGTVNQSFALADNLGAVKQMKILSDESILVSTGPAFVKLNASGIVQPDFSWSQFKTLYNIDKFKILDNGKIMAADANNLFRLNANGSEDTSFDIGTGICCTRSTAFDFDIQSAKTIYGSVFDDFNGVPANKIVRLDEKASVDLTFNIGTGPSADASHPWWPAITLIKVLDSNEVLVGGFFTEFNGVTVPHGIVKLSADGAMDLTFNENQKLAPDLGDVFLLDNVVTQVGSKIIIGQPYIKSIYVVNLDGTVDPNFKIPSQVGLINDLIPYTPSASGGRQTQATTNKVKIFAMGTFALSGQADPSFLLKMSFDPDDLVTSVEPATKSVSLVKAYPNPFERKLMLDFEKPNSNYLITIYDYVGRPIFTEQYLKNGENSFDEIDFGNEAGGTYVMKVISDSGESQILKVIKR